MLLSLDLSVPDGSSESIELWVSRIFSGLLRTAEFMAWCLGVGAAIVVPLWFLQRYRLQRSASLPKLVASAPFTPPAAAVMPKTSPATEAASATAATAVPVSPADAPASVAVTATTAAAPLATPPAMPAMAEAKS